MSLPAMSLGDWFSVSRKGGMGELGWYIHLKGINSTSVSGFGCKIPQQGHLSHTLSTNGPRKESSYL